MCVVPEPIIIIIVIIEKELHAVAPPIKCIALNYTLHSHLRAINAIGFEP